MPQPLPFPIFIIIIYNDNLISFNNEVVPLPKYYDMKTYTESKAKLHIFLTSVLDGNEWPT